jgi:hypothetical protein
LWAAQESWQAASEWMLSLTSLQAASEWMTALMSWLAQSSLLGQQTLPRTWHTHQERRPVRGQEAISSEETCSLHACPRSPAKQGCHRLSSFRTQRCKGFAIDRNTSITHGPPCHTCDCTADHIPPRSVHLDLVQWLAAIFSGCFISVQMGISPPGVRPCGEAAVRCQDEQWEPMALCGPRG